MKRILSLIAMLLAVLFVFSVAAGATSVPDIGDGVNYAPGSSFTLSHTHASELANFGARYDATTDTLTLPQSGMGEAIATKDISELSNQDFAIAFSTHTRGWANDWHIRLEFMRGNNKAAYLYISDLKISYFDPNGVEHEFENTLTNGRGISIAITRRLEPDGQSTVAVFLDGELLGELTDQTTLPASLRWVGSNGSNWMWDAEVIGMKAYVLMPAILGDANGDGKLNPADVTCLARYLANWEGYADILVMDNADTNKDGKITLIDVVALRRYLANWGGYELPYFPVINVEKYGVDKTGATDVTTQLTAIHATGKRVYYPNGTYLFNGKTLDFSGGVRFESIEGVCIRNNISDAPVVNIDDFGNLIGLMQNHQEKKYIRGTTKDVTLNGNLVSPPLSTATYTTKADFVGFWYSDFGRTYTVKNPGSGWIGWYDWQWNHHGCESLGENYDPYDPTLHPLLGWYRGDDPVVLDWICYWLHQYGIEQVCTLTPAIDSANWSNPANADNWMYQLLHNVPNAENMGFCIEAYSSEYNTNYETLETYWLTTFDVLYRDHPERAYCYVHNGKRYPVVFLWDEQSIRFSIDYNRPGYPSQLMQLYQVAANYFKDLGYDGVCILARFPYITNLSEVRSTLNANGVIWYTAAYPTNCMGNGSTYGERVNNFVTLGSSAAYSVATGVNSHTPHPSNWECPGNTPALFGTLINKAVNAIYTNNNPHIITCYNVSEWAEGGPGLIPTVADRFGYLEAVRDNILY